MNENELVARLKEGDPGAIDELVDHYKKPLFAFIIRVVSDHDFAEDVFQETWIKVIRHIKSFRGDSRLSTWLFQIALNQCRDALRKKGRYKHVPLDEAEIQIFDPALDTERIIRAQQVRKIVAKLPVRMREVIVLKYFHDMGDQEIADVIGCPVGTVKSRVHRASKIIRRKWTSLNTNNFMR